MGVVEGEWGGGGGEWERGEVGWKEVEWEVE